MLRVRTGYSFRQAAGSIDEVMSRLKEIGATHAPITDRASTFGFYRWAKAADKAGLRPVFGVELAVTPSINEKKPATDNWTFFAKESLAPLNRLVELATTQFRFQPLLTLEQAIAAANSGELYVVAGHRQQLDLCLDAKETLFVALAPSTPRGLLRKAQAEGWKFAATSDNRYPREGDRGFYEVLVGRHAETQTYPQHILSPTEWLEDAMRKGASPALVNAALENTMAILDGSVAKIEKAALPVPEKSKSLLEMCKEGAKALGVNLKDATYKARLKRELDLIAVKGYEDYFYIVADICQWARKHMVVGPARGSSCGSLVCYLIGITTVDPIPFGLIFERFVDINRNDMPDIDIDFSDQQRFMVFDYIRERYGSDRSARLGTVALFKARSALAEIGGALRIPRWKLDAVADSIVERSSADSRALQTLEDALFTMPSGKALLEEYPEAAVVQRFEGHPRHYSQHAAGVVIAERPITDYVAVDHRTGATMCDKKDAEDGYNLLKIDALGLTQLSVFEDCLRLAKLPLSTLEEIPLDDPAAFAVLNDRKYFGIFQFNGRALQNIAGQIRFDKFDDIVSTTALGRPGPLASGGAQEWIYRRIGREPVSYPHPVFEPYLKDTLGIVIYQEQVMEIGRNVGNLDWGQVTALRKAMSKSLGKEFFDQFGDPWKAGAIANGVSKEAADKIWDELCAYGSWSFNKSHSVAYGIISYWCCWLKAHYPLEFAAATLTHEGDPERQVSLLREVTSEGFDYVPVDAEFSTDKWAVGSKDGRRYLVGPLSNVKGIGPASVKEILNCRANGLQLPKAAAKKLLNAKTPIDSLWPIRDAVRFHLPDPAARNIITPPTAIGNITEENVDEEVLVFCTFSKIAPRDMNDEQTAAKRGYKIDDGKATIKLNSFIRDDTGEIYAGINRWRFEEMARPIIDRGRAGKALYAIKGRVMKPGTLLMIAISNVRYIGDTDEVK